MTRNTFTSASPPPVTGPAFADNLAAHIKRFYDAAAFPLTSVGGTANAVTASLSPVLDGSGLVTGMRFGITWAATNTGAVTLAINGGTPVSVLTAAGAPLVAGQLASGTRSEIEFVGSAFRVLTGLAAAGGLGPVSTTITASLTYTKPGGYPDDTPVLIQAWGGGGGGSNVGNASGGGGGGGYAERWMRYADVPSSLSVVIGAGGATGATGAAGGNTTVGSLLVAFGGGGGSATQGGGGGGELAAGTTGTGGLVGGGDSGATVGGPAKTIYGGGGGGETGAAGGGAVHGGGGGGGGPSAAGGLSARGGAGGAGGSAGTAPGGGGGRNGAGARGEVRIWIMA